MKEAQAKKLLGWQELEEGDVSIFLLKDIDGNRIRCCNNINNRPLDFKWCLKIAQEILRGRWMFNFENIIIGETGLILSGQHRLIALVLACQTYRNDPDAYPEWKADPTIRTSIGFGAPEDDRTVNTLDTAKPRSLSDVIYRCQYFAKLPPAERKNVSKMMQSCVQFVWDRTGVKDAYSIERTHAESIDFIELHKTMLKCVNHISLENEDKSISALIPCGTASGMMYLMATSASDPQEYKDLDHPSEKVLDLSMLEKAEEFWTEFSGGKAFDCVRKALRDLNEIEDLTGGVMLLKKALVIKAWNVYTSKKKVTAASIKLKIVTDDEGYKKLDEFPNCGGIDFDGLRDDTPDDEEDSEEPTEEEAAAELEEEVKAPPKRKSRAKKAKPADVSVGDAVTVKDDDANWEGVVTQLDPLKVEPNEGFAGAGKSFEVDIKNVIAA